MERTVRALVTALLGRHPEEEILQAYSDRELGGLANRITRHHLNHCDACQEEIHTSMELLELLCAADPRPGEISIVRDRIITAMSVLADQREPLVNDVERLLGRRAAARITDGTTTPELRVELAAFLGNRAADSFLHGITG